MFLATAGAVAALGNTFVIIARLAGASDETLKIGDIGFIAALLLGIVGLIAFPSVPRRGTELMRMVLDGVVIGGSALVMMSLTVYPQVLATGDVPFRQRFTSLVLPLVDVVVATLAALLILRSSRDDRPALALVSAGFALYALSDIAFAVLTAQGPFTFGTPVDVGWIAGYVLIALAARHHAASVAHHADVPKEGSPVFGTVVMFSIFLSAGVTRLVQVGPTGLGTATTVAWLLVLIAVATRQTVLIIDNERLRQGLERRVSERTADLRRLTRRSELLLSSVADGIYGVNRDGLITSVNPVAAKTLGYGPEDLIGKDAHVIFHANQEDGTPFPAESCYISEAIREGIVSSAEEDIYVRADGREIPVEVTASPLTSDISVEGAVVVFRDVTQRREVDRLKTEFVSIVSHELRTPLTSIRGSLGLLAGGALGVLPPGATRMIDIALDSSERLTRLINDILDIERIESGALPMEVGDHTAQVLIEAAMAQVQVLAAEAGVTVVTSSVNGRVHADADRVVQTLINLLGNAIKFSPAGSQVIVAAAVRGAFVQFSVVDRGRGIPTDKLDSVFTRFEQVDSSDAREKGGTGLGLAISRSLIERLGGRIWAERNPNGGTTFRFTLPRVTESDHVDDGSHGPLVIVCDDDEYVVEVLSEVLQQRGYRAVGVSTGHEALELITLEQPAAVLLDLVMPGTSGGDVVAALKRRPETQDIPVVVVSGLSPGGHAGLESQTAGWLVKPVDQERLSQTVAAAIADHPARGTVLLVEDDRDLANVIRTLFERRGLTVYYAATKVEALRHLRTIQPQVMILDLHLPDGDGIELVAEIRRNQRLAQMPVVVYSAVDIDDKARDSLRLGPTAFLTKGRASPQQLEDRVLELLGVTTGRDVEDGGISSAQVPVHVQS
ncbi:MAG: hypothetical protein QOF52_2262 [Propionibacteriaceae bacterium]|nr:hypothetical protein [Propionibacteriaceae bacterium]